MSAGSRVAAAIDRIELWHILLVAGLARLIWASFVPVYPVSDAAVYEMLARRLADGHGYSWPEGEATAYWPVGTSALYAAIYTLFGRAPIVVAMANAILGTALVAAVFALARTQFSEGVARAAAAITAVWPTWIAFTTILSSELPANLLFVLGLACALSSRWTATGRTIVSTALIVAATYMRANLLPFVLLVPLLVAIRDRRPLRFIAQGAVAVLVAAVLIAPWAARNHRIFGEIVPISTNFGVNLWIGNNPLADGGYMAPPPPGAAALPADEVAQDKLYRRVAIDYIAGHPARYLQLCLNRIRLALDRETFGVAWNEHGLAAGAKLPLKLVMTGYWYAALLAALIGGMLFIRRCWTRVFSPLVVIAAATMAPPILILSSERYHYALAPFVAIFAAYALVNHRRETEAAPGADNVG